MRPPGRTFFVDGQRTPPAAGGQSGKSPEGKTFYRSNGPAGSFPTIGKIFRQRLEKLCFFGDYSGWRRCCRDDGGRIRGMGGAQAFAPLREGGAARWKTVAGVHIRSGWKGRRGEYCGLPSRHASAWSIRRGLEFFVAGIELCLAATAPRSTPPVAAPAACLLPVMDIPSMAAPPPSRRGGVSCRPP